MSDNNAANNSNALRLDLEENTLQELRTKAKKVYGIPVLRDHNKDDLIRLILGEADKFDFAVESAGDLKAGWSRIKLQPTTGRSSSQVYLNVNGRSFAIPVNVEVDVPNKVVGVLNDAVESLPVTDQDSRVTGFSDNLSYPFTLIESKPGPDPRPGNEVQREAKLKAKRAFEEANGYWPSDMIMNQQRQLSLIRGG